MTLEQVLAIRAIGLALVAQCDAALAQIAATASPVAVERVAIQIDGKTIGTAVPSCSHPPERVISTAVAGSPLRGKCTVCGSTVERAA